MILKPCTKCLVKTVCESPCPRVKKRKRFFDKLGVFIMTSGVCVFISLFFVLYLHSSEEPTNEWVGIIGIYLLLYLIFGLLFETIFVRIFIRKAIDRFPELGWTAHAVPPPLKPRPPPPTGQGMSKSAK